MYILYLGLEPFVRRAWPGMLVGWTRFVGGRIRDPIVGHDILIGVACGAALALVTFATLVVPPMLGLSEPQPHITDFSPLFGIRGTALTLLNCTNIGMQNMLITTFEFAGFRALFELVLRRVTKRSTLGDKKMEAVFIALATMTVALVAAFGTSNPNQRLLDMLYQSISITVVLNSCCCECRTRSIRLRSTPRRAGSRSRCSSGWRLPATGWLRTRRLLPQREVRCCGHNHRPHHGHRQG